MGPDPMAMPPLETPRAVRRGQSTHLGRSAGAGARGRSSVATNARHAMLGAFVALPHRWGRLGRAATERKLERCYESVHGYAGHDGSEQRSRDVAEADALAVGLNQRECDRHDAGEDD